MICSSGESRSPDRQWDTVGKLAIGVAHDFNNVLASISGFAELILERTDAPNEVAAARHFARSILEAASIGQSAVRELQGLVRNGTPKWEHLDAHLVLSQAISLARGSLTGAVNLDVEYCPGSADIVGRRGQLHNVFINLFLNARDAMPRGGTLTVRTSRREGGIVISVRDTGTGMTEDVRRRLFQLFHTTKGEDGNGVGLHNALATVESHGGRIEVETVPDQGTEFRILLPLAAP